MLILLTVVWGLTFPATKKALEVTDPMHFLFLRFAIASVLLTPYILYRHRRFNIRESASNHGAESQTGYWNRAVVLGGIAVGFFLFAGFALQVVGLEHTTASRSGFFTGLLTIFTPILAHLFGTSKSHWLTWLGLVPALFGIYLLASPETGGLNIGDILTIGCAVAFAFQMIVLEAVSKKVKQVWLLTFIQVAFIFAGALVYDLIFPVKFSIAGFGWLAAFYTGLFGTMLAVWMQTRYQPDVPAGHAALIFTLEPVFASLFAWLLLGETWTVKGFLGAAFVFFAMLLSSIGIVKQEKRGNSN